MIDPRTRHLIGLATTLAVACVVMLPVAARAQTAEPSPGTPQANQYEIPVQAGRHDAAPPKNQNQGNSGNGSLYRSNNNFGSSSVVPGDPGSGGGPAGGASAGGGSGSGGSGGGAVRGAVGGAAAGVAGVAAAATPNSHNPLDTGSPSTSAAYTMLPLIIILGILIGIAGVWMRRRADV